MDWTILFYYLLYLDTSGYGDGVTKQSLRRRSRSQDALPISLMISLEESTHPLVTWEGIICVHLMEYHLADGLVTIRVLWSRMNTSHASGKSSCSKEFYKERLSSALSPLD